MINFPTPEQLKARIKSIWTSLRPGADTSIYSDVWLYQHIVGDAWHRAHQTVDRMLAAIFPPSSFATFLGSWCSWFGLDDGQGGYGRITARASDNGTVLVTGTIGAEVKIGDQLTYNGIVFELTEAETWAADETISIGFRAFSTGLKTNVRAGTILTFVSPPAGIQSTAEVSEGPEGGADAELDSAARLRLRLEVQTPSQTGNWRDWVRTVERAAPGSIRAFCWINRESAPYGYGRTDYMGLKLGEFNEDKLILESTTLWTAIADEIENRMPGRAMLSSRQMIPSSIPVSTRTVYTLGTGVNPADTCDWDANTFRAIVANPVGAVVISAADKAARELETDVSFAYHAVDNPQGANVGDIIKVGDELLIISTISSDVMFNIETWPAAWADDMAPVALPVFEVGRFIISSVDFTYDSSIRPGGVQVGDRILIDGSVATVESIVTTQKIETSNWPTRWYHGVEQPTGTSVVGKYIVSGGGLVGKIYNQAGEYSPTGLVGAVFLKMNQFGPGLGLYAAPIVGWESELTDIGLRSSIIQAGGGKVVNVEVENPIGGYATVDDLSDTVQIILPGEVVMFEDKS